MSAVPEHVESKAKVKANLKYVKVELQLLLQLQVLCKLLLTL